MREGAGNRALSPFTIKSAEALLARLLLDSTRLDHSGLRSTS